MEATHRPRIEQTVFMLYHLLEQKNLKTLSIQSWHMGSTYDPHVVHIIYQLSVESIESKVFGGFKSWHTQSTYIVYVEHSDDMFNIYGIII